VKKHSGVEALLTGGTVSQATGADKLGRNVVRARGVQRTARPTKIDAQSISG